MSDTLANISDRVRDRCNDRVRGNPAFSFEQVRAAVNDALMVLLSEDAIGSAWSNSYVTLTADTIEYTLTTSVEYFGILGLKRNTDGYVLKRETPERLEEWRSNGLTARDRPTHYALIEDTSQHVRLRVYKPISTALLPEALDAQLALIPSRLSLPGDTVALSRLGIQALELTASSNLVQSLTDEEAQRLHINSARLSKAFAVTAERLIAAERARVTGWQSQSDITLVEH